MKDSVHIRDGPGRWRTSSGGNELTALPNSKKQYQVKALPRPLRSRPAGFAPRRIIARAEPRATFSLKKPQMHEDTKEHKRVNPWLLTWCGFVPSCLCGIFGGFPQPASTFLLPGGLSWRQDEDRVFVRKSHRPKDSLRSARCPFGVIRRFSPASSRDFIAAGALGSRVGTSDRRCSQQVRKTVSEKERT